MSFKDILFPPPAPSQKTISLNLKTFVPPPKPKPLFTPPVPKVTPTPQQYIQEALQEAVAKRKLLDDKKPLTAQKANKENNTTKEVTKNEIKTVEKKPKKKITKVLTKKETKKVIKATKSKKTRSLSKDPLANLLMTASSSLYPQSKPRNDAMKMIQQFYGKEFNTFTSTQKKFIKHNLNTIQKITQQTLSRNGYPSIARRTRQQGTNVVSFYLHPNGDITSLRLKSRIGYSALDDNTLKIIRIAYKDYPRPKTKTKITFYVNYRLYP